MELLQNLINGPQAGHGMAPPHLRINHFRGGMEIPLLQQAVDRQFLGRHAQTALMKPGGQGPPATPPVPFVSRGP